VGRVTSVGPNANRFKVGEFVAVGTMVDSCLKCNNCKAGLEPYCEKYATWTYNAPDRISGDNTQGGYSDSIVVREEFVLKLNFPEQSLASVAPLLCAGIKMWSPLRHWKIGPGSKVGIVGIGGLFRVYRCRRRRTCLSPLIALNSAPMSSGSPPSGLLPLSEGRVPRWSAVDLEVHDRLFETFAILLCHLILHE
jgi:hypothetical protein